MSAGTVVALVGATAGVAFAVWQIARLLYDERDPWGRWARRAASRVRARLRPEPVDWLEVRREATARRRVARARMVEAWEAAFNEVVWDEERPYRIVALMRDIERMREHPHRDWAAAQILGLQDQLRRDLAGRTRPEEADRGLRRRYLTSGRHVVQGCIPMCAERVMDEAVEAALAPPAKRLPLPTLDSRC